MATYYCPGCGARYQKAGECPLDHSTLVALHESKPKPPPTNETKK